MDQFVLLFFPFSSICFPLFTNGGRADVCCSVLLRVASCGVAFGGGESIAGLLGSPFDSMIIGFGFPDVAYYSTSLLLL